MQQNEGVSPPGREQLPTCSSYCIQLTLHWLLQQLHLQIKCFTYIWYFPLPSTLRPKFILQAHKVLCFDLQNFLLKRKPAAGLCLKNKCNLLPPQKKMHSETDFSVSRELCYWRWQGVHEKWSDHCRPPQPEYKWWKRSASDGKDGTSSTWGDVRRLHMASVKRHGDDLQVRRSTVGHMLHWAYSEHGIYRTWRKKSLFSLIKNTYRNACFEENIIHFFLV